ncbi:unnamed protein product [Caenorhabditis auriculariae]|uniref:Uncharacterized protein n=1 Tax=Caenorhabditis auriculariae TaxID=2777116 RepID=A0A8S1GXD6_9PELO|nr:unnamed protein product [Caenorhabditis auriculariae]
MSGDLRVFVLNPIQYGILTVLSGFAMITMCGKKKASTRSLTIAPVSSRAPPPPKESAQARDPLPPVPSQKETDTVTEDKKDAAKELSIQKKEEKEETKNDKKSKRTKSEKQLEEKSGGNGPKKIAKDAKEKKIAAGHKVGPDDYPTMDNVKSDWDDDGKDKKEKDQ